MNLLFDLDGTLTDSYPGIVNSFCHTMTAMGRPAPETAQLQSLIGPPLRDGLALLLDTKEPAVLETAVARYREYFAAQGMYENTVYPGIRRSLAALRDSGAALWVVTSKTEVFARKIAAHFGLAPYFAGITGSAADGSHSSKTEMIAGVMARSGLDPEKTAMIGDRKYDIIGALDNGITAVGVLWGYGTETELSGAGASVLCREPAELPFAIQCKLQF
ncbi:MAG: HAD hydrolase-like protein [Pseudomonadota bacterium]